MKTKLIIYTGILFYLFLNACSFKNTESEMEVSTNSQEAKNLFQEGIIKGQNGNYFEAMNAYENAIQKDSDFFMAYCQNAAYYLYFNNTDKFRDNAEKALHCHADLTKAEEILKKALVELLINPAADVSSYGKALVKVYPNDANAYLYYAFFQSIPGDIKGAVKSYKKAMELEPDNGSIYQMLGYAYLKGKQYDKAREAFKKFAGLYPGNAFAYESMGDYYVAVKDFDKAGENYRRAYDRNNELTAAKEKMESITGLAQ